MRSDLFQRAARLCVAVLAFSVVACRASVAPDAGFIQNPEVLKPDAKLPFDAVWFKEGIDLNKYNKVYIAPIDTTHLLKLDWWDRADEAPGSEQVQAQDLTDYFREKLVKEFTTNERKTFTVVDKPSADALLVELAIVEVVPTKVWLNAIGYIAIGALSSGTTAFEGRLRDGSTNQVIAEFKDREHGQLDVVSIDDLTWYKHSEHTIRIWSEDIAHICYRAPDEVISPMSTVTLRPW
jgi:hypothetical protein